MLSFGIDCWRAVVTAVRRRGLALISPPPIRAATVISLISLVKALPRLASVAAFLCLIELHFEWPDIDPVLARATKGRSPGLSHRYRQWGMSRRAVSRRAGSAIMSALYANASQP